MTGKLRGHFITLEGGDGAGKSTQGRRLADWLEAQGKTVILTREPGGTEGAEAIRTLLVSGTTDRWLPLSEALLHMAARAEHVGRVITPALERGDWVICDRFFDSTRAYQGAGQGLEPAVIMNLHTQIFGDLTPDLTLLLDVPEEQGLARVAAAEGQTRYERFDRAFHARLRQAFLGFAAAEPERFAVFDAGADVDSIADQIQKVVMERLGS